MSCHRHVIDNGHTARYNLNKLNLLTWSREAEKGPFVQKETHGNDTSIPAGMGV